MKETRTDILPEAQRRLLPRLSALRQLGWVLYGGTAIALQLGHRTSVDFDFFTDRALDREALRSALPWLDEARVLQEEPQTWTLLASSKDEMVKLSFFGDLGFGRVGAPLQTEEGLLLASLEDLLGHKLKVLLQRVEAKDYRDIAAMLAAGQNLRSGLAAAMALFPNFPSCEAIKALTYFEGGDLLSLSTDERALLVARAEKVRKPKALKVVSTRLAS